MLGVMDIYALRRKVLVEGKSQRSVAREMGLARDTVRRYLETPTPERQERRRSSPVLDRVRPRLEQLLEEWSPRTTDKQRITGRRLHRQLREEGYEVGLTLVLAELREWRRRRAEVYVPLVHRPAESAQVDFFEVRVDLAGARHRVWLLLFRLMHSGRDFVRLYERQDQLAFLDGHVRAFEHFGGVPRRMVYDNLAAAVRRVQFPRRRLSERFAALASHYAFEANFARPGEGHDKGGVESRGRGVRWQVLNAAAAAATRGTDLGAQCRRRSIGWRPSGSGSASPKKAHCCDRCRRSRSSRGGCSRSRSTAARWCA